MTLEEDLKIIINRAIHKANESGRRNTGSYMVVDRCIEEIKECFVSEIKQMGNPYIKLDATLRVEKGIAFEVCRKNIIGKLQSS